MGLRDLNSPTHDPSPPDRAFVRAAMRAAREEGIERFACGALITAGGRLLIVRRAAHDDFLPGMDEIPGGAVEPDEDLLDAVRREVKEETSLSVIAIRRYVGGFDYLAGSGRRTRQFNFVAEVDEGDVVVDPREHASFAWVEVASPAFARLRLSAEMRRCIVEGLAAAGDASGAAERR